MATIFIATTNVSFGKQFINETAQKSVKIENTGIGTLVISSIISSNEKFSVLPTSIEIGAGLFAYALISYIPTIPQIDTGTLTFFSNDLSSPQIVVNLSGEGMSSKIVVPQILDFGSLPLNSNKTLQLSIRNDSSVPLEIFSFSFNDSQFSCNKTVPFTIAANSQFSIPVVVHTIVIGSTTAAMLITSNDYNFPTVSVELNVTSLTADIFVIPSNLDFESCAIGSTIQKTIKISNNGQADLNLTIVTSNIEFSSNVSSLIIHPSQSLQIYITFSPGSIGEKTSTITLQSNDPDSSIITILCSGTGASPKIVLPVENLSFGSVCVNSTKEIQFQIKNEGSVKLIVDLTSNNGIFSLDTQHIEIEQYSVGRVLVRFSPLTFNSYVGILTLVTNDVSRQIITIPMTGTGASLPIASISPDKINFGTVTYGLSKTSQLTIKNTGSINLTFNTQIISNPVFLSSPNTGTVSPASQQVLSVSYTPNKNESSSTDLVITTNDVNNQTLICKLTGKADYAGSLEWQEFSLDKIIPEQIKTAAEKITEVTGKLSEVLGIMKGILNLIKSFIIDISDPIQIILKAIQVLIDNLINDLSATGIYLLAIYPGDPRSTFSKAPQLLDGATIDLTNPNLPKKIKDKYADSIRRREKTIQADDEDKQTAFGTVVESLDSVKGGSKAFFNKIIQSFDDTGDSKRPQFSSDAYTGGIVLVADSGDIANLLNSVEKLLKIFNIAFKVQFDPPTNLTSIGGNKQIRLTFSPNDGIMADSYIIWRSVDSGGTLQYERTVDENTKLENKILLRDKDGNPVSRYTIVGVTTSSDQLAKILDVTPAEAEKKIVEAGFYVREVLSNAGEFVSGKYIFEDKVENGKPYYYVISAANIKNEIRDNPTSLIGKNSDDFVYIKDPKTGKVERKTDPHSVGILALGPYSTETSASGSEAFATVVAGMARCKNYRCMSERTTTEEKKIEKTGTQTQSLLKTPISSSIQVKLLSGTSEIDIPRKDYTVQGKVITFNRTSYFKSTKDVISTKYSYLEYKTKSVSGEMHLINNVTKPKTIFSLKKMPVESTSLSFVRLPSGISYKVIDDLHGKVELTIPDSFSSTLNFDVSYNYYVTDDISASFRCVNPEHSKAYFDPIKCNDGTTLCPAYENRNCIWNTGEECTNTNKSGRLRSVFTDIVNGKGQLTQIRENIPFSEFWDATYCQNVITSQRCDGFSKSAPRAGYKGTPPDWVSYTILDLVPDLKQVIKLMSDVIESLMSGTEKFGESILTFLNLIEAKIDSLQKFIDQIDSVLTMITEIFSGPGFYLLNVPLNSGGNEYFKKALMNAKNGPSSDIFGYTAGITILYGGPSGDVSMKAIEKALKMLFGG
jgi:Abnormal spindle-like microcephaly-assoc'd, ASPM-SPD-2-Hydin